VFTSTRRQFRYGPDGPPIILQRRVRIFVRSLSINFCPPKARVHTVIHTDQIVRRPTLVLYCRVQACRVEARFTPALCTPRPGSLCQRAVECGADLYVGVINVGYRPCKRVDIEINRFDHQVYSMHALDVGRIAAHVVGPKLMFRRDENARPSHRHVPQSAPCASMASHSSAKICKVGSKDRRGDF